MSLRFDVILAATFWLSASHHAVKECKQVQFYDRMCTVYSCSGPSWPVLGLILCFKLCLLSTICSCNTSQQDAQFLKFIWQSTLHVSDSGPVRNMQNALSNKSEKLSISSACFTRIQHDVRSPECQIFHILSAACHSATGQICENSNSRASMFVPQTFLHNPFQVLLCPPSWLVPTSRDEKFLGSQLNLLPLVAKTTLNSVKLSCYQSLRIPWQYSHTQNTTAQSIRPHDIIRPYLCKSNQ